MKKIIFLMLIFLTSFSLFAQNVINPNDATVQQILIPKEVFVGDTVNLKYSFRTTVDLFALADKSKIKNDTIVIDPENKQLELYKKFCTIKNIQLIRNGLNYTIDIIFIPWQTGELDFAKLDLTAILAEDDVSSEVHFYVDFAPVTVDSLSEYLGVTTLRPPAPPVTVPGTNYWIWSIIILILVILILAGMLSAKMPKIIAAWERWKKMAGYSRNARNAVASLRKLSRKKNCSDKDFGELWQKILRIYLNYRFNYSFNSVPGSLVSDTIRTVTGDMFTDTQQIAIETLSQYFTRTDYIRYAQGSIDSNELPVEEHKAVFADGERKKIYKDTVEVISTLEKNPEGETV